MTQGTEEGGMDKPGGLLCEHPVTDGYIHYLHDQYDLLKSELSHLKQELKEALSERDSNKQMQNHWAEAATNLKQELEEKIDEITKLKEALLENHAHFGNAECETCRLAERGDRNG